jgi:3-hydroxyisobutyrate dehydrogenase
VRANGDGTAVVVGFVGAGVMGQAMVRRLAAQGHTVRAWNRTQERLQGVDDDTRVEVMSTPRDVVHGAELIITSVADEEALQSVVMGADGLLGALAPGQLIANMSTVSPLAIRRLAGVVEQNGGQLLDVGILGNRMHAEKGELRMYVGGREDAVARARPILEQLSKEIVHAGDVGAGMAVKIALNLLMGIEMQALAEASLLGVRLGVERGLLLECLSASGYSSPVMSFKARRMIDNRYEDPDFRLALMTKDLGLVVEQARLGGFELPAAEAAHRSHVQAVEAGHGEDDCAVIATAFDALQPAGNGTRQVES